MNDMTGHPGPVSERFWAKVDTSGECWLWTACTKRDGYGRIWHRGKVAIAHRVAWELERGPIPEGLFVCHHCDNHRCVRPDHLFLGTQADNLQDMTAKGRRAVGERLPQTRLTDAQIAEMRRLYRSGGMLQRQIAHQFGTYQGHVSAVVRGLKRTTGLEMCDLVRLDGPNLRDRS